MNDKLISEYDEKIPAPTDLVLVDDGSGFYKKSQVGNFPGGSGGGPVDVTAPFVSSRITPNGAANTIVVVFSESVIATTAGWSATKNGSAWPISSVAGSGTTWTFTMGTAAINGDTLRVSYNSSTGSTVDGSANELVTFTDAVVTNNVGVVDTTAPTVVSATTPNGAPGTVVIVFSESVTATTAGWSFKKNGSAWSVTSIAGSGNTWTFTMGSNAVNGDTLLRSYNSATGSTADGSANELVTFTDQAVSNAVGASFIHQSTFTADNGTAITAYTPEIGNVWANNFGTAEIQNNKWSALTASGGSTFSRTTLSASNYTAKCRTAVTLVGGTAKWSLRHQDADNAVYVELFLGVFTIGQQNGPGTYATITSFTPSPSINDTNYHDIEFIVSGSSVEVKVDGTSIGTASFNSGLTANGFCVGSDGANALHEFVEIT